MLRSFSLATLAGTLGLGACGGGPPPPDADEGLACVTSHRGEDYVVGLDHPGMAGALDFKLMSATPAPPGFNDNTWIIQINSASGTPATGATITVTPFMPDHQHGTLKVNVQPMPAAGQYKLSPINMWMPGLWETTIDAQAGAMHDTTVFRFCIQA